MARPRRSTSPVPSRIVVPQTDDPPELVEAEDEAGDDSQYLGDLIALADQSYNDVQFYFWRLRAPGEIIKPGAPTNAPKYSARLQGPLDLENVRDILGGGIYRIGAYRNGRLLWMKSIEIEGPRKDWNPKVTIPPTLSSPSPNGAATDRVLEYLQRVDSRLDQLEQRLNAGTAPGITVADVLKLAPLIRGSEGSGPGAELLKEVVSAFKSGMELRASVEGGEKSAMEIVLEKLTPTLDKVATAIITRPRPRPPARPAPRPAGAPVSEATVLPSPGEIDAPEPESYRWSAAVEALANAISEGDDPADFAITLERILNKHEIGQIRFAPTEAVYAELVGGAGEQFPVLKTEQAKMFLDAVLAEIKSPSPGDGEAPAE